MTVSAVIQSVKKELGLADVYKALKASLPTEDDKPDLVDFRIASELSTHQYQTSLRGWLILINDDGQKALFLDEDGRWFIFAVDNIGLIMKGFRSSSEEEIEKQFNTESIIQKIIEILEAKVWLGSQLIQNGQRGLKHLYYEGKA